jgi:16S rRNA (cytosine1402-N4)-methyltransferase
MNTTNQHHPVMLQEVIAAMNIIPDGIYVDGTFGRGGHSAQILQHLNENGRLICLDKDPQAIDFAKTHFTADPRVTLVKSCFSELSQVANELNIKQKINGILLDLGVSSPQLDEAERGFSFMRDGPLDMRMDPTQGVSASEWLNKASLEDIIYVLRKYGEESFAPKIARKVIEARAQKPILTTLELANLISGCIPWSIKKMGKHPATKTFQAIRIHINQEMQTIEKVLGQVCDLLAPAGRFVVISFHSLEDRSIKQYFRDQSRVILPKGIAIVEKELKTPLKWIVKRQRPSQDEIGRNGRARSATLRVAERSPY